MPWPKLSRPSAASSSLRVWTLSAFYVGRCAGRGVCASVSASVVEASSSRRFLGPFERSSAGALPGRVRGSGLIDADWGVRALLMHSPLVGPATLRPVAAALEAQDW